VRLPNGDPLPVILLANKCDMVKTALNEEVMDQYCKEVRTPPGCPSAEMVLV
jgi:hypothetical protein